MIRVADEYRMYFDGHVDDIETERDRAIGLAVSSDAVDWTLHDDPDTGGIYAASDPVLLPAPAEAWDGGRVMAPSVIALDEGYVMVYQSSKRRADRPGFLQDLGYATSDDGVNWVRSSTDPMLDNRGAHAFITNAVAHRIDDEIHVYYDSVGFLASTTNAVFLRVADIAAL